MRYKEKEALRKINKVLYIMYFYIIIIPFFMVWKGRKIPFLTTHSKGNYGNNYVRLSR
jgi:hypothetical protein